MARCVRVLALLALAVCATQGAPDRGKRSAFYKSQKARGLAADNGEIFEEQGRLGSR